MSRSEASGEGMHEKIAPEANSDQLGGAGAPMRDLPEAAKRALAEAAARRAERDAATDGSPKEVGGAAGPDPARYGDWEKDGIVSDF